MKNRGLVVAGSLVVLAAIGSAYMVGRARAAGVPATAPLTYAGTLTDASGVPLTGSKNIQVQVWDAATAGNIVCSTASSAQTLAGGAFSVALPAACATGIHANPDLWSEVLVDGASLGRVKLGAVPYALEADSASNAVGALNTRIAAIEGGKFGAHDPTGAPLRICSGSTPIGNTNWQNYNGQVTVVVDISGCGFTSKATYFPVLAGTSAHWTTTGGSTPYLTSTPLTSFQIYVNIGSAGVSPAAANTDNWHIEWIAIGN
jgi:hypothetical protein